MKKESIEKTIMDRLDQCLIASRDSVPQSFSNILGGLKKDVSDLSTAFELHRKDFEYLSKEFVVHMKEEEKAVRSIHDILEQKANAETIERLHDVIEKKAGKWVEKVLIFLNVTVIGSVVTAIMAVILHQ